MDQQKLRTLVFEKTGIKIDATDPVFALVALNESVLEETLQRHLALLREHTPAQWHGTASAGPGMQAGTRQPAFKAGGDNFEADDELARPAESMPDPIHDAASDPAATPPANAPAKTQMAQPAMHNSGHHPLSHGLAVPWDARLLWLALAISFATALLVLAGQAWLQPKAGPATLSPEQKAQLQRAERLGKAVEKLDAKARTQLQAELDKL